MKKMKHNSHLILSALVALTTGCSSIPIELDTLSTLRGVPGEFVEKEEILEQNSAIWQERKADLIRKLEPYEEKAEEMFAREREWIKRRSGHPEPRNCVALSGGGLRSGIFSLGVLKGLEERKLLDRVDIISAVSGGSYAATGLYAQHFLKKKNKASPQSESLLDDDYMNSVKEESRLFKVTEFPRLAWNAFTGIPRNLFENGITFKHTNTNGVAEEYRKGLKKIFYDRNMKGEIFWVSFTKEYGLPYLIVNATIRNEIGSIPPDRTLAQQVFEFTPIYYGSDGIGRFPYKADADLDRNKEVSYLGRVKFEETPSLSLAMATSGAALDFTVTQSYLARTVLSASNVDLGRYFLNPLVSDERRTSIDGFIFPFYRFSDANRWDKGGTSLYVTDGGHSDNLGLFSLIRRGCRHIVVVDGEYDPEYTFGGYKLLRDRLLAPHEMGVRLSVPDADKAIADHKKAAAAEERDTLVESLRDKFGKEPISKGSVAWMPVRSNKDSQIHLEQLEITYIKLAYPLNGRCQDAQRDFCLLRNPTGANAELCKQINDRACNGGSWKKPFPQEPTFDLDWDVPQTTAYMNLGQLIVGAREREIKDAFDRAESPRLLDIVEDVLSGVIAGGVDSATNTLPFQ
jgi:hypothetical protein